MAKTLLFCCCISVSLSKMSLVYSYHHVAAVHALCCCVSVCILSTAFVNICNYIYYVAVQARSLLTAHEDFTTLMFTSPTEIQRPGLVFSFLKKHMPSEDTVEEVKRMSLTADGKSAVFDVPSKLAQVACSKCIQKTKRKGQNTPFCVNFMSSHVSCLASQLLMHPHTSIHSFLL